jgi:hypothetical protein
VPNGTRAFAVVVHDPDAPLVDGFTSWVVRGIPADVPRLPEGASDMTHGGELTGRLGLPGSRAAGRSRRSPRLPLVALGEPANGGTCGDRRNDEASGRSARLRL